MYHISSTKIVKVCHLVSLIKKNKKIPKATNIIEWKKTQDFLISKAHKKYNLDYFNILIWQAYFSGNCWSTCFEDTLVRASSLNLIISCCINIFFLHNATDNLRNIKLWFWYNLILFYSPHQSKEQNMIKIW